MWCCYGPPVPTLKPLFWDKLKAVIHHEGGEWAGIGDFNDVVSQEEKWGAKLLYLSTRSFLKEFIHDIQAIDLGFIGNSFT